MPKLVMTGQTFDYLRLREKATLKSTAKATGENWFSASVSPTNAPANHRIYIQLEGADSVCYLVMNDGTNTINMNLNGGTALVTSGLYGFDVIVPAGYSYNVRHLTSSGQRINSWVVETNSLS